jgi:hypothetical protein
MDEEELHEIKARSDEFKRLLGHGSYVQNLIENDVPKLVAEVEEFKAKQEHWQGNIQSLKEEFSARITGVEERLKGIEASRAAMREVLEYVRGKLGSLNISESLSKIDLALSVSTVGQSDSRQAMDGNGAGDDSFQPSKGRRLNKAAE